MNPEGPESGVLYRVGNPPTATRQRKGRKAVLAWIAALSIAVLSVAGGVVWFAFQQILKPEEHTILAATASPLERARSTCAPDSSYAVIGDQGKTLILRFEGNEEPGLSNTKLRCFMTDLKVTDAVRSEIGATRALDGRRSADWGNFHGSWSYHPDSGLKMTITMR